MTRSLILLCALISAASAQIVIPQPKADVIFIHGNIYTGAVDASASLGAGTGRGSCHSRHRILAVGTRNEIAKLKGPETKIIDLGGHFVMPGFNDAHLHLAIAGLERMNVNMVGAKDIDEFRERLRAKCEAAAPGEWVVGAAGTKLCGPSRFCRAGGIWMR